MVLWNLIHDVPCLPASFFTLDVLAHLQIWKLVFVEQEVQTEISLTELQKRLVIAELTLGRKEHEITVLREQLQQYEAKWLEYECKMKTMEEMWQNQMASLQVSFFFS